VSALNEPHNTEFTPEKENRKLKIRKRKELCHLNGKDINQKC